MKPASVRVIGVGSPAGDDQVGWYVVEALKAARGGKDARVSFETLDRPGAGLVERMQGARAVVLVDAVRSGAPPGTLHRFGREQIRCADAPASSHGFGLAEAWELAEALGDLPPVLVLYGVEIASCEPGRAMSDGVSAAVPRLVTRIANEISLILGSRFA